MKIELIKLKFNNTHSYKYKPFTICCNEIQNDKAIVFTGEDIVGEYDDGVERWFEKYDEESDEYVSCAMSENTDDFYAEFVFFKDGKINKFVSNKDYQFES